MKRRDFIGMGSLAALPLITGFAPAEASKKSRKSTAAKYDVNFILDGYFFEPKQYIQKLSEIESSTGITGDFYSQGGVVSQLEDDFCKVTEKESAIYMPSGTLANELSIRMLCGEKTKAIVHEASHIFRDEGDAAQAIHNKRLVPIETDKHYFTKQDVENKLIQLEQDEVFYDGVGALSIENPVRRHNGKIVDIKDINEITDYAKSQGIRAHLDGARLHLASAYSGVGISEYAAAFDTVYISLYKYLGAAGGAILCGDKDTIEPMRHMMKILGGTVFRSWTNAAVARHFLKGLDSRLKSMIEQSTSLIKSINELDELEVEQITDGTNLVYLKSDALNLDKFADTLDQKYGLWINSPENNKIQIHLNESLLLKDNAFYISAIKGSIIAAKK